MWMSPICLVSEAAEFAARRHTGMARKGRGNEPYINHLAEVANLLAIVTGGRDADLIAVGWLHDTIEDTATTQEELAEKFNERVANLVFAFEPGDLISETMSLGAPAPIEVVVSGRNLADSSAFMPVPGAWGRKGSTRVQLAEARVPLLKKAIAAAWQNAVDKAASKPAAKAARKKPARRSPPR